MNYLKGLIEGFLFIRKPEEGWAIRLGRMTGHIILMIIIMYLMMM